MVTTDSPNGLDQAPKVGLIGTGQMGTAFARIFLQAGRSVTVWDIDPSRCADAVKLGAREVASPDRCVAASDLTIVCVTTYESSESVLRKDEVLAALSGSTVLQLTTGTPDDARATADWMTDAGAAYLDGAIFNYPRSIGTPDGHILYSGPKEPAELYAPTLSLLGGGVEYVGDDPGLASTFSNALAAAFYHVLVAGWLEAIAPALDAGATPQQLQRLFKNVTMPTMLEAFEHFALQIEQNEFSEPEAPISRILEALDPMPTRLKGLGYRTDLFDTTMNYLRDATDAGYGEEGFAGLLQLLRHKE
ncbi:NAD(P)-dependent oxidoreductase [Dietzia lutea]|uniref:Uncharacterized protein n=1 Tax=Dietzia lutea TaxID=546160 RepID=A0A2S1RCY3_9ACTN|nr:NAD(P)-binding domain-containing protein [Dietzia lutea]AWH94091.1 hypothetical protein A6035_17175 [Dietzia lutea]